jgi:uncharacterized membrane protein YqjE
MAATEEKSASLFGSVRRLLDTGLSIVESRVELLAIELQEEKHRLAELVLLTAIVAALGTMALTLATLAIVVFFWQNAYLIVLAVLAGAYLIATALAFRALQRRIGTSKAFAGTLNELRKDRGCLQNKS